MADYVYLKNMSQVGDIAISRRIFVDIATEATNRVIGASVAETKTKNKLLVMLLVIFKWSLEREENIIDIYKEIN